MSVVKSKWFLTLISRDVALTVLSVGSLFLSILWVSAFLYGSFYFFYMPSQTHEVPLNFKFDPCSEEKNPPRGAKCSFLYANVSFCDSGESGVDFTLSHGQSYEVFNYSTLIFRKKFELRRLKIDLLSRCPLNWFCLGMRITEISECS
jgi:hypothetical protein